MPLEPIPRRRLAQETSPYLLQHADNPVDWFPWGEEAFEKARREDKPIFLSVGYATCHWCHVMARESFEDPEIAAILNENFVNVKVDRQQRPDVDELYMRAVLIFTNGHGGWPMSVFLTPDGKPFYGGTYFPREAFKRVLLEIARMWREEREKLLRVAGEVARAIEGEVQFTLRTDWEQLSNEQVLVVSESALLQRLDRTHGGFGGAPKFPPHHALEFLLRRYEVTRKSPLWEAIELTLHQMARGGIYDHIGGGFHRYSVDARWLIPHFEKMLYDNAQLAQTYAWAFALSGNPLFQKVAQETYAFVLRELASPEGAFYSALDAESIPPENLDTKVKEEGAFYLWRPEEVKAVLGERDGELFCKVYGISDEPNFVNPHTGYRGCVPNLLRAPLENWAKALGMSEEELQAKLSKWRECLRQARLQRPRPPCDDQILTNWNALMVRSFALGFRFLGDTNYRLAAERAANFLLTKMRKADGTLWHSYRNGIAKVEGMLDDYANLVVALTELHEVTGESVWLQRAQEIADTMVRLFYDFREGGFWFTTERSDLLARSKPALDGAEPSPNGMAALGLIRLAAQTGEERYAQIARQVLETFGGVLLRYPQVAMTLLCALHEWQQRFATEKPIVLAPPPVVRIRLEPEQLLVKVGEVAALKVHLDIAKGWHIGSFQPQAGTKATELVVESPLVIVERVEAPPPQVSSFPFAETPLSVYKGTVTFVLWLRGEKAGTGPLTVRVSFQACDDRRCEAPTEITATIPVTSLAP